LFERQIKGFGVRVSDISMSFPGILMYTKL
jgi:hypothetical protein